MRFCSLPLIHLVIVVLLNGEGGIVGQVIRVLPYGDVNGDKLCLPPFRPANITTDYFRLPSGSCRDVISCGLSSILGLRCPNGLYFDIHKQVCQWEKQVLNCGVLFRGGVSKKVPFPPSCQKLMSDGKCRLPECFCDSKSIPGGLELEETPQMIGITFHGAINSFYSNIYRLLFRDLINPDNCSAKGTFFVSHKYSNYSVIRVSWQFENYPTDFVKNYF